MAGYSTTTKKKATGITYEQIVRDVNAGDIKPIYYLMGEESYYIDRVADYIVSKVLTPEEQDFCLLTFYGPDSDIEQIMAAAKAYPMGAKYQVILVKEAQGLKHMERMELYLRQIQPSTVLIICHKNGTIDRRLKVATMVQKVGVLFESKRLYDNQLPTFVCDYFKRKHIATEPRAAEMLAEHVGADLNRLASEIDKLILALPAGQRTVSVDLVRANIGLSKNFNIFELQDAIKTKDIMKANKIAKYFDSNPKENPIQMVLPSLFKFFTNVMLAYYAPDKSPHGLAAWLKMNEWHVKNNILPAMQQYSGVKVMHILSEIRRTDARSKGVDNPATSNGDLMKELLFFILH